MESIRVGDSDGRRQGIDDRPPPCDRRPNETGVKILHVSLSSLSVLWEVIMKPFVVRCVCFVFALSGRRRMMVCGAWRLMVDGWWFDGWWVMTFWSDESSCIPLERALFSSCSSSLSLYQIVSSTSRGSTNNTSIAGLPSYHNYERHQNYGT